MKNLFLNPSRGWVGMDIDESAIHMAQVERKGTEYSIGATWTAFQPSRPVAVSENHAQKNRAQTALASRNNGVAFSVDNPQIALESMIDQAKRARTLFSSSSAGITIGGGMVEYREFELHIEKTSELDGAVYLELEKEQGYDAGQTVVKAWELPTGRRLRNRKQSAAIVTADYDFSMWLGDLVSRAGYVPEVLDALPCALARASEMFLGGADHPCLMVHIGDTYTTLTLVHQGLPILTRILNHHGFEKLLIPLASEFEITLAEVNLLLMKAAVEGSRKMGNPNELMEIVSEFQLRFVQSLAGEIYRTLEYIRAEHGNSEPKGILLCGNGSVMPMLSLQFEQLLEIPTETWSLACSDHVNCGMPLSLYAVAAGLSTIAWEEN